MTKTESESIKKQFISPEQIEQSGEPAWITLLLKRGAFYLKTRHAPPEIVRPGDLVALHEKDFAGLLFFTGRADPHDPAVPEEAEYFVRRPFRTVIDGLFKDISQGTLLRLTRAEALDMMRKRLVKPLDESVFYLP